jgi:AmmeMemoRadiSam system protein B
MCDIMPMVITVLADKELDATKMSLVDYATSGGVGGDYSSVVNYVGIIVQ